MNYSELLQSMKQEENGWTALMTEDWLQGRSAFGGIQAAIAVKAMRHLVSEEMPLRSLQTTFIAPVPPGTFRVTAQVLRSSKNTTHVEARLLEGDKILALLIGVFGGSRPSKIIRVPQQSEVVCDKPVELRFIPGVVPNFTQHFSAFWIRGGLPFSGNPLPEVVVEVSMKDSGFATESHILAIADFIPPVALSMMNTPSAGSSLTWMLEFLGDSLQSRPLEHWRIDAEMVAGQEGYTSQSVMIWGPGGEPVALSRQSMVVFG
ncbi:MAG: thioesterase family protein [SAR324 cluster bacterium]|nr:thioesterase family protein [SAR324 cluster bacterium]